MAVSTLSSRLVANNIVRAHKPGVNGVYIEYTTSASLTIGDVIQMVPVPHGARITDLWVKIPNLVSTGEFNVGYTSDPDHFLSSATATAARPVVRANLGLPVDVSVSDDIDGANRYETVDIQFAAAASTTSGLVFGMYVEYIVDEPQALF